MDFVGLLVDENKKRKKFLSCLSLSVQVYVIGFIQELGELLWTFFCSRSRAQRKDCALSLFSLSSLSLSSLFEEEEEEEEES